MYHLLQHIEMANDVIGDHVNIAGTAQFRLTFDKNGHVICAKAVSGNGIAISHLLDSVSKWKFAPYRVHGIAKNACGTLILKFSIVEGQSAVEALNKEHN
jgi:hypothetical protein